MKILRGSPINDVYRPMIEKCVFKIVSSLVATEAIAKVTAVAKANPYPIELILNNEEDSFVEVSLLETELL